MRSAVDTNLNAVFRLFDRYGGQNYGEDVTQLEHMVQCGHLAEEAGYDDEVVLAALFHDIGHLCDHAGMEYMGQFGAKQHDLIGAAFLRDHGFSEKVAALVAGHVAAKRYLTYKFPEYHEGLSHASKQTLVYQGGPMTSEEAAAFEQDPYFEMHIKLREWDDAGKRTDLDLHDYTPFVDRTRRHLEAQAA